MGKVARRQRIEQRAAEQAAAVVPHCVCQPAWQPSAHTGEPVQVAWKPVIVATWRNETLVSVIRHHWVSQGCRMPPEPQPLNEWQGQ